jgi:ssDNA-binding Zn-finger/Zn-ribbon topoisomerase 1
MALCPHCPKCGVELVLKPVPGAVKFPQRLECPEHGYVMQPEKSRAIRMRFHRDAPNW